LKIKHEDNTQQSIQNALKKKSYLTPTSERAMKITKNIGEMIALDYQPYSIVDDRGFKNLLNTLESKYKLPTRQYLSSTVIPQLYSTLVSKLKDEINSDLVYLRSISFTFDIWTSAAQQPYISLTTHYLSKQFKLKNKTLGCSLFSGEHSGKNIFFKIKNMVQEWNIDIVNSDISIFMVTDSARNMKSAFSNFNENNNLNHFFCAAHKLQLAIDDALKENNMNSLLKKCRSFVTHYNHSNKAWERLQQIQCRLKLPNHKLIQMVETRWNSVYLMLERIIEQREAIVLDLPHSGKDDFTGNEWRLITGYVEILKPVLEATEELIQENIPTFSMVIPIVYTIEAKLNNYILRNINTNVGLGFARSLKKSMKTRFQMCKNDETYIVATVMDPRFKTVIMEPCDVDRANILLETEIVNHGPIDTTSEIAQTIASVPSVQPSSLWDVIQERSMSTSVSNESPISLIKNEVRFFT